MKRRCVFLCAVLPLVSLLAFAADIDGKWTTEATGKGAPETYTFKVNGSTLTGTVDNPNAGGVVNINNGKVQGDMLTFEVVREIRGNSVTIKFSGTVSGKTIRITLDAGRGPRDITLTKL